MPSPTLQALTEEAPVQLPSRRSVGDDVYEVLLSRLIALKIPPGARISIDGLARELGTSQTPVRAALIRLEAEGLIIKTHLVGYSATEIPNGQRFAEIFRIRALLEPDAAARAATSLSPEQRADLRALADKMFEPSSDDEKLAYGKFAHWDAQFHRLIALCGGGPVMAETLDRLHTHMHLFRVLFHSRVTQEAIAEHEELLQALVAGDAERARAAMQWHIQRSFKRILPVLQTLGGGASPQELAAIAGLAAE